MNIHSFVFNPFYENTVLVWDDAGQAVVIDPGCYERFEQDELAEFVQSHGLKVVAIVNTHTHIDHVLGNYWAREFFKCPLWVPEAERDVYFAVKAYAPNYGFTGYTEAAVDSWIRPGEVKFGDLALQAIACAGHSPGHLVFYHAPSKTLIGGDVLFNGSIGRTDLPGGNHEELLQNIRERIYTLPDDVTVYPGHGPTTTIGQEKLTNPFVRG
jgi:hydroxyacylglutathione hydrolase